MSYMYKEIECEFRGKKEVMYKSNELGSVFFGDKVDSAITLDECIKIVSEFGDKGEKVYMDYMERKKDAINPTDRETGFIDRDVLDSNYAKTRIFSDQMDIDRYYRKIKGKTRDEFIDELLEDGAKNMYPQKREDWMRKVEAHRDNIGEAGCVEIAVRIMEELDKGDFEQAYRIYKVNGFQSANIKEDVFLYSNKGPEFVEYVNDIASKEDPNYKISDTEKKRIEQYKEINKQYEQEIESTKNEKNIIWDSGEVQYEGISLDENGEHYLSENEEVQEIFELSGKKMLYETEIAKYDIAIEKYREMAKNGQEHETIEQDNQLE